MTGLLVTFCIVLYLVSGAFFAKYQNKRYPNIDAIFAQVTLWPLFALVEGWVTLEGWIKK